MERDAFIKGVLELAPVPVEEQGAFDDDVGRLYDLGFSIGDALAWVRTFEEVSPDMDENRALMKRTVIGARYLEKIAEFLGIRIQMLLQ